MTALNPDEVPDIIGEGGSLLMNKIIKTILLVCLCQCAAPALADADGDSVLVRMFAWWNEAIKDPDGFTEEAFREYYTEDAAIIINGKELMRGIKPMVEHFRRVQAATEWVEIVLPFEDEFESADGTRIFTHHFSRARADGVDRQSRLMGYAVIEDGRISLVDFVRHDMSAAAEQATEPQ